MRLDERPRSALPSLGLTDERRGPNRGSQLSEVEGDPYPWSPERAINTPEARGTHETLDSGKTLRVRSAVRRATNLSP